MKKFLNIINDLFSAMSQARAAAVLARMGKTEEAKKLYN